MMSKDIAFETWLEAIDSEEKCGLATVIQEGTTEPYNPLRVFINEENKKVSNIADSLLVNVIGIKLSEKLADKNPTSEKIEMKLESGEVLSVFMDIYVPTAQVMIFGAGHDAVPVAEYSVSLGYQTTVVDAREGFNTESLFPNTHRIIVHPESYSDHITITKNTYVIVMNHHIDKDRKTLQFVLKSEAPYVGVLGPRSRRERMINQLNEEGTSLSDKELSKMHSPVGLDIGATTPQEIAISILAEIIALRNGHSGGFLHDSKSIHKRAMSSESSIAKSDSFEKVYR